MQISDTNILLTSQRSAMQQQTVRESLRVWRGDQQFAAESNQTLTRTEEDGAFSLALTRPNPTTPSQISSAGPVPAAAPQLNAAPRQAKATDHCDNSDELMDGLDPELKVIKLLIEKMFHRRLEVFRLDEAAATESAAQPAATPNPPATESEGWGVAYEYHESYRETEQTSVSAGGVIHTADGQQIRFELELAMSREFMADHQISVRLGDAAKDPLVVNFDGGAAQLSSAKFMFDLDADGRVEEISFVGPNSAFLALDRNGDGAINNGSELFGPASGNGFADLAAFDEDANHWIDANDTVFADLRLWRKDAQGQDYLQTLAETGIGALYLKPVSSEFSLKNNQNELDGQVRATSVYVSETGAVGTMQQIDLAI